MVIASAIIYVSSHFYKPIILVSDLLNVDSQIVFTIAYIESNFSIKAESPKGAKGIFQVMPSNLKHFNCDNSYLHNIIAGILIFKKHLRMFDGDVCLALASYNAGPTAVRKYNGVPPYTETRNYLKRFLINFKNIYKEKESKNGN